MFFFCLNKLSVYCKVNKNKIQIYIYYIIYIIYDCQFVLFFFFKLQFIMKLSKILNPRTNFYINNK